ncbi:MAG: UvrD-helicase domain-containing protein, partial [Planctomycetaceae bacterium]
RHVIIRASAGTGKTFRLTNQYLQQLFAGAPPEQILATTFTRKAAGEILERNMMRLASAGLDEKECAELAGHVGISDLTCKRCLELLKELTAGLHRVRICTLDAFFANIASSFGFEMGLPPDWSILDEIDATTLKNQAIDNVLRSDAPNDNEAAASIVQLMSLLTKGETTRSVSDLIRDVVGSLYPVFQETDADAWSSFPKSDSLSENVLQRAISDLAKVDLPGDKRCGPAREKDVAHALAGNWETFIGSGLAKRIKSGDTTYYKKDIGDDAVDCYRQLIRHSQAVLIDSIARQTDATYKLLCRYDVRYSQLKDDARSLQFNDVTRLLADVARDSKVDRLSFRMDGNISHVLLDEFQDTSLAQWRVIRPFAEKVTKKTKGTSFFCVGDIKQAIYGWRGGVAEIFDAIENQLSGLKREELNTSFRSADVIMKTTNAIFNGLKSASEFADADSIQEWCAGFGEHTTARDKLHGYASLESAPAADEGSPQADTTLKHAAARIAEITKRAPDASIGVLVRKNRYVSRMIFELRRLGISASEEGGNPVNDSAAVQLIFSLLALTDHPGNTVARFHVSQSPLAESLFFPKHYIDDRADHMAREIRQRLQSEGYGPVIQEWAEALRRFCDSRGKRRLVQLVELAWRWQSHATLRTADFLNFVEAEKVPDPTADRVRVMTVHQSKGLEFDVVVLPNLDEKLVGMPKPFVVNRPSPTEPIDRVCRYRNSNVQELLPADFQQMFADARRHQISESLCVLYVAVTRAKHAVHMIIAPSGEKERTLPATMAGLLRVTLTEPGPIEPGKLLFKSGLVDWYETTESESAKSDGKSKKNPSKKTETAPATQPAVSSGISPAITFRSMSAGRSRGLQRTAPSRHATSRKVKLSSVIRHGSAAATERGTLIHAWFELIEWLNDDAIPDDSILTAMAAEINSGVPDVAALITEFHTMRQLPVIAHGLRKESYHRPDKENLTDSARKRLSAVSVERIRLEVKNEHPFAVLDDGEIINGFIDRLVLIHVDNQLVAADIVDFKTDSFDFSDEELFKQKTEYYGEQLQMYARVVSRLYRISQQAISTRLFMLGAGRIANV